MNQDVYKTLTDKERIVVDILLEIAGSLKKLERDITADIERTLV